MMARRWLHNEQSVALSWSIFHRQHQHKQSQPPPRSQATAPLSSAARPSRATRRRAARASRQAAPASTDPQAAVKPPVPRVDGLRSRTDPCAAAAAEPSAGLRQRFEKDGFITIDELISRACADELNVRLERVLRGHYDTQCPPDKRPKRPKGDGVLGFSGNRQGQRTLQMINVWKARVFRAQLSVGLAHREIPSEELPANRTSVPPASLLRWCCCASRRRAVVSGACVLPPCRPTRRFTG